MASSVQVYRYDGLKVGKEVVEPLLADNVLVARGSAELDANALSKTQVTASVIYRDDLKIGDLVSLTDPTTSTDYLAKITGIRFHLTNGNATQNLTLERQIQ